MYLVDPEAYIFSNSFSLKVGGLLARGWIYKARQDRSFFLIYSLIACGPPRLITNSPLPDPGMLCPSSPLPSAQACLENYKGKAKA